MAMDPDEALARSGERTRWPTLERQARDHEPHRFTPRNFVDGREQ